MTRSFSDTEKRDITKQLLSRGKALFERYGLKKTSVEELTRAVGIGQGSFYLFFDSKEELFFEILDAEERELRERIARMISESNQTKRGFKEIITRSFQLMNENAVIKNVLVDAQEYSRFFSRIPEERLKAHLEEESAFIGKIMKQLQTSGVIRNVKPEVITGLLFGLFLLQEHKSQIGEEIFPHVTDLLIDTLCDALVTRGDENLSAGNASYLMEE